MENNKQAESGATEGSAELPPVPDVSDEELDRVEKKYSPMIRDGLLQIIAGRERQLADSLKPEPTGAQGRADTAAERLWDEVDDPVPDNRVEAMAEGKHLRGISAETEIMLIARELWDRRKGIWTSLTPSEPVSPQPQVWRVKHPKWSPLGYCLSCGFSPDKCKCVSESPLPVQEPQEKVCPRCEGVDDGTIPKCDECGGSGTVNPLQSQSAAPELPVRPQEDKSEGVADYAVTDPPPLPVDEKFTFWLDDEGDYMVQSQREPGLQGHAATIEDAVWRMRETLAMASLMKPSNPAPTSESGDSRQEGK